MNKIVSLLICLFFCSCSQSINDKILSSFEKYAQDHFDDPSKIQEIIGVDSVDTCSTYYFKDMARKRMELYLWTAGISDSTDNMIKDYSKRYSNRFGEVNGLLPLWIKKIELAKIAIDLAEKGLVPSFAKKEFDNILEMKDTILYEYKILYRIKEKDGLKMCNYFAYSDSLNSNILFQENRMPINKSPFYDLLKQIDEFHAKYQPSYNYFNINVENNTKIINSFRLTFGELE